MRRRRRDSLCSAALVGTMAAGCYAHQEPAAAAVKSEPEPESVVVDHRHDSNRPEPAPPAVEEPGDWPWPGPFCFAYSPRLASYGCVSLSAVPTEKSKQDLSSASILSTMSDVRRTRADVEIGVDLVSVNGARTLVVLDSVSIVPKTSTLAEVRQRLRSGGYTEAVTERVVLEPDVWTALGSVEVRYAVHLHEGDASFEYSGSLELRCSPAGPIHEVDLASEHGLGGPFAVASSAADTSLHAITVEHQDGGEGHVSVVWNSYLLDAARWCGA